MIQLVYVSIYCSYLYVSDRRTQTNKRNFKIQLRLWVVGYKFSEFLHKYANNMQNGSLKFKTNPTTHDSQLRRAAINTILENNNLECLMFWSTEWLNFLVKTEIIKIPKYLRTRYFKFYNYWWSYSKNFKLIFKQKNWTTLYINTA